MLEIINTNLVSILIFIFSVFFVFLFREKIGMKLDGLEGFSLPFGIQGKIRRELKSIDSKEISKESENLDAENIIKLPSLDEKNIATEIAAESSKYWNADVARDEVYKLAREYELITMSMGLREGPGNYFEIKEKIFLKMRVLGLAVRPFLFQLSRGSPGEILAYLAALQMLPSDLRAKEVYRYFKNPDHFFAYQALVALVGCIDEHLDEWEYEASGMIKSSFEFNYDDVMPHLDSANRTNLLCIRQFIDRQHRKILRLSEDLSDERVLEEQKRVEEIVNSSDGPLIKFVKSEKEFRWSSMADNLLDFAEVHGIEIPASCHSGMCQTCQTKVISGKIRYLGQSHATTDPDSCLVCNCIPVGPVELDA